LLVFLLGFLFAGIGKSPRILIAGQRVQPRGDSLPQEGKKVRAVSGSGKKRDAAEKADKSDKSDKDKKDTAEEKNELFLPEVEENQEYMSEIYRCGECGYEQDEPGNCPDHDDVELVLVASKGRNPLEPPELDGNEDLVADMPLKGLEFRKNKQPENASSTAKIGVPQDNKKTEKK